MNDSQLKLRQWLHWIRLALDICAVGLVIFLVLMLIPRRPWFIEMLCNFLGWVLLPSVPIFILSVALSRLRSVAVWTLPSLAFLILFGGLFLPSFGPRHICASNGPATCKHLRVMTFNMLGGLMDDRQSQIDMLRDSGADIIALQEVSQDGAEAIENQLAELYPYRVLLPSGIAGTGILSKYPIEDEEFFVQPPGWLHQTRATIDVDGLPITVISAHPLPPLLSLSPFRYRARNDIELTALVQMVPERRPALLMGDFNFSDQSSDYRILTDAGLADSFREVGWGFGPTWPASIYSYKGLAPLLRIDYIWHTYEFQAVSARTGPRTTSDHLPVIVDLVYVP